jgi:hypothetical protein
MSVAYTADEVLALARWRAHNIRKKYTGATLACPDSPRRRLNAQLARVWRNHEYRFRALQRALRRSLESAVPPEARTPDSAIYADVLSAAEGMTDAHDGPNSELQRGLMLDEIVDHEKRVSALFEEMAKHVDHAPERRLVASLAEEELSHAAELQRGRSLLLRAETAHDRVWRDA